MLFAVHFTCIRMFGKTQYLLTLQGVQGEHQDVTWSHGASLSSDAHQPEQGIHSECRKDTVVHLKPEPVGICVIRYHACTII